MIRHIGARSVNEALNEGLQHLSRFGIEEPSRNGPVIVSPTPVITTYYNPERRVLVNSTRDANPFFHLFESLWMLAGRNDLTFPAKFVSDFGRFSDDGETLHGAYGYRWRKWFGYDQLDILVQELRANPSTRRAVLSMWDGAKDLSVAISGGKDVPCNTHAYFDTIGGKLNMTVSCRSNDIILGAYGANAVHFSILLEYVAAMTGIPMGVYRQFSNNFHAYTQLYPSVISSRASMAALGLSAKASDPYNSKTALIPLFPVGAHRDFHDDLLDFVENFDCDDFESPFFAHVVCPMYSTWSAWKTKRFDEARHLTLSIRADDWRLAAQDWLSIREQRRQGATDV